MRRLFAAVVMISVGVPLGACTEARPKEQTGTGPGAGVGGTGGAEVGRGSSGTAIVGGVLVGQQVGGSIDRTDEMRAQQVLENNRTDQATSWRNPETGADVRMVPVRTYQSSSGDYCRQYNVDIHVGGHREEGHGTACRQPQGTWRLVN
jgi:surface antigen